MKIVDTFSYAVLCIIVSVGAAIWILIGAVFLVPIAAGLGGAASFLGIIIVGTFGPVAVILILAKFGYRKQPANLAVMRIESFPKSHGPQIAGVISRYTGMYGVDDLLKKLPVEFEVRADAVEDLKSQLVQLGCN